MEKIANFFKSLLNPDDANSSKRFIGLLSSISLIVVMFVHHTDTMVQAVAALAGACIAGSVFENIFKR